LIGKLNLVSFLQNRPKKEEGFPIREAFFIYISNYNQLEVAFRSKKYASFGKQHVQNLQQFRSAIALLIAEGF